MKKTLKIVSAMLIICIVMFCGIAPVFALNNPSELKGDSSKVTNAEASVKNVGNALVSILQTVGIVLSVVILIVLGIKYMMGSASEKAEYKKTMIPYLIGALLIFAASVLANVVYEFFVGIK